MFEFDWRTPHWNMDTGASGGGDMGGGGAPAPDAAPAGGPPAQEGTNPLLDDSFYTDDYGGGGDFVDPTPAAPTVEELDFAGRKVPVTDPVIRDLHRDYLNLTRTFQETQQASRTYQEQNQVFQQMVQMLQSQQGTPQGQQAQAPQQPQLPGPEDNERFMNQWYESPIQTVEQMIQQSIEKVLDAQIRPVIEPIQRERQYSQEINRLSSQYTDFQDHIPVMQQIIGENPKLAEQGLETVYWVARGQQAQQQPTYTPDQLLNDPNFRQQLIGNEGLRNEIVSTYMQQKQAQQRQAPTVMGNQPGGNAPAMPENRPKTLREASKAFARYLGG